MISELLSVEHIDKHFYQSHGLFRRTKNAVLRDVSLAIGAGESIGLVGESGSGKTTLARCIMGIMQPDFGTINFDGVDIALLEGRRRQQMRRQLAMVYQNPYRSLNPHFTLFDLLAEPIQAHENLSRTDLTKRITALLDQVGLSLNLISRKVGALSGGQAQRIAIARALALDPKLIILDEPTSALDVSVQAQILNLLKSLQSEAGCSYLFITHNLDVVRHACNRVLVMLEGQIVEHGDTRQVLLSPQHEYTKRLIAATPQLVVGQV